LGVGVTAGMAVWKNYSKEVVMQATDCFVPRKDARCGRLRFGKAQ